MAGAINRLGIWALDYELYENFDSILGNEIMIKYYQIFTRIFNRALTLLNTNRPKVAIKIIDFFTQFVKINSKIKDINQQIKN